MTSERDDNYLYFRAIEEAFVRLRGSPLLLSPSDWRVAKRWFEEGIPLDVVAQALRDVFERRAERGATSPVQGLRYCAAAVAEAWNRRRELGVEAAADRDAYRVRIGERLESLARNLPDALPERERWAERVRALDGEAGAVESELAGLDARMMVEVLEALPAGDRAKLQREADSVLAALAEKIDAAELGEQRERFVRDAARRRLGLPLLSLFSPEALEESDSQAADR